MTFDLSASYFGIWFVGVLLRRLICHCLIATFSLSSDYYDVLFFVVLFRRFILCLGDSYRQNGFDQPKISYYGRHYVEELES